MQSQNSIPFCPELHPSMKEFNNFEEYVTQVENKYSKDYGMVKIVPPKGWKARKAGYEDAIQTGIIPQPIEQNAYGKGGIYECLHIMQKSVSMREYRRRMRQFENVTDGKSVEECEEMFYKTMAFSPPLYGADARNTLFDPGCKWNLGEIHTLLNDGLNGVIPGVNDPYLYVGAWKTMFTWHREDFDLAAINYLHHGKSKFWYAIPESDKHYLDQMAKLHFADNFTKCPEFMRHKTTVIRPTILQKHFPKCRVQKVLQKEGEFIIVFGGAYHHGFNYGFNIAEAVNFATKNWLKLFVDAKPCKCISDLVKLNHKGFYENMVEQRPELKNDPIAKEFLKLIKLKGLFQDPTKKAQKMPPIQKKKIEKRSKARTPAKPKQLSDDEEDTFNSQSSSSETVKLLQNQKKNKKQQKKTHKEKKLQQMQKPNMEIEQIEPSSGVYIEEWLQCNDCSKWRKIDQTLKFLKKRKNFFCDDISIKCNIKQNEIIYTTQY